MERVQPIPSHHIAFPRSPVFADAASGAQKRTQELGMLVERIVERGDHISWVRVVLLLFIPPRSWAWRRRDRHVCQSNADSPNYGLERWAAMWSSQSSRTRQTSNAAFASFAHTCASSPRKLDQKESVHLLSWSKCVCMVDCLVGSALGYQACS